LVDPSLSGAATSSWSTSVDVGSASSLLMCDIVFVEPPASRQAISP
jgi:hypothetical protein